VSEDHVTDPNSPYGRKDVIAVHGRCGTCHFADLEHAGTLECRRFPPQPYFEPTGRVTNIRARVGAYYWCGEYAPATNTIHPEGKAE
jgi:hypothetical protein